MLLALVFWAYSPALDAGFVFDDESSIVESPAVHWATVSVENAKLLLSSSRLRRRPVANLTLALDHAAAGLEPRRFHLTNILIHLLVGMVLAWLCWLYLRSTGPPSEGEWLLPASIAVTGVFLLHPLNTQAVTYIVQRMTSLAALFTLLAFGSYLMARRSGRRGAGLWYLAAAAAFLLALGTKENAVLLVPVVALYEWCFCRDRWRARLEGLVGEARVGAVKALGAVLGLLLVGLVGWSVFRASPLVGWSTDFGWRDFTGLERVLTQSRVQLFYLSLLVWPSPGRLNLDHDFAVSRGLMDPAGTLFAMAFWAVAILGVALLAARRPRYGFPLLAYLVFHSIEAGPVDLELVFEHRMYLPGAMLALLGATALKDFTRQRRRMATVGLLLLWIPLAGWTHQRNVTWSDPLELQRDIAEKSPNKSRAQHNLANALLEDGRPDEALDYALRAIELDPTQSERWRLLGSIYLAMDRPGEARAAFSESLTLRPGVVRTLLGLGSAMEAEGQEEQAFEHYTDQGIAFAMSGRPFEAIPLFQAAVDLRPESSEARTSLGNAYSLANMADRALEEYRRAVELDPTNAQAWYNRATAADGQGLSEEASAAYRAFVDVAPPTLQAQIARALTRIGVLEAGR